MIESSLEQITDTDIDFDMNPIFISIILLIVFIYYYTYDLDVFSNLESKLMEWKEQISLYINKKIFQSYIQNGAIKTTQYTSNSSFSKVFEQFSNKK